MPHDKLWTTLLKLGVSTKLIRVLKSLYDKATIRIKTQEGLTKEIDITEGVLQGEILSPFLFIICIADIVEFFRSSGLYGVNINLMTDILILLYADDLAIIARNKADLATKLKSLYKYCELKGLIVNKETTKILYCRKAGKIPSNLRFFYDASPIEGVSNFTYLGVPVASTGLGRLTLTSAIQKAKFASGAVISLIYKAKISNFNSIVLLFDSMISSVTLYASSIWALRYTNELDFV